MPEMLKKARRHRDTDPRTGDMAQALDVLERVFGYHSFRSHQRDIIETVLAGGDALVLMPTGGGKSLCYQIPAIVRPGTGIVVSPLVALMQDQVDALKEAGVAAAFLNSTLSFSEQLDFERRVAAGALDLLYVAPERLVQERTLNLLSEIALSVIAIDEAHCVSQWGHDFRPEYRQLRQLAQRFPSVPRIALTATADERTREEIVSELALTQARRFVASFDRPNIRYIIAGTGQASARDRLWQFLSSEHQGDAGIIYCLSRRGVEETAAWLNRKGRVALPYHAGLDAAVRRQVQHRFLAEDGVIVVATIAFGMGIDKPDVRFVAHLNLPKTIEAYYQETGRAGRDGAPANAWLAYGMQDIIQLRQWIAASEGSESFKQIQRQKLDALIGLAEMATCRRQALLAYFGERAAPACGNCDNCLDPPATEDGTVLAQKALSAVYRTGQRYGVGYLVDVLTGKIDERIARAGHDRLTVFGVGKDVDSATWRALYRQLVAAGHLAGDDEGRGTLQLCPSARAVLRGETAFLMHRLRASAHVSKSKRERRGAAAPAIAPEHYAAYQALKQLRQRLAAAAKLPPYVIFHDKTLAELVQVRPATLGELGNITGLGTSKIARYGQAILDVLAAHRGHPALNNRLSATVNQTLALHLQGLDAQTIATRRSLDVSTVYGHLAEAIEAGLIEAHAVVGLDPSEIDEVLSAFERLGTVESGRLGPVFAALDGRVDYGILKCLLAEVA